MTKASSVWCPLTRVKGNLKMAKLTVVERMEKVEARRRISKAARIARRSSEQAFREQDRLLLEMVKLAPSMAGAFERELKSAIWQQLMAQCLLVRRSQKSGRASMRLTASDTGGRTFHFEFTTLRADRNGVGGIATAHMNYIVRQEAVDAQGPRFIPHDMIQPYIEDPAKLDRPQSHGDAENEVFSFGNIGDTAGEAQDFWLQLAKHAQRPTSIIQNRLIVEIPHQAPPEVRIKIMKDFCAEFDSRGLPFHCALHRPTEKNDARNFHAHIVYSARPAQKIRHPETDELVWDFACAIRKTDKHRNTRTRYPFKQKIHPFTRERDFLVKLRSRYAAAVNSAAEAHGLSVRFDPRSHRDMGFNVAPMTGVKRGKLVAIAENRALLSAPESKGLAHRLALDEALRRQDGDGTSQAQAPASHQLLRILNDALIEVSNRAWISRLQDNIKRAAIASKSNRQRGALNRALNELPDLDQLEIVRRASAEINRNLEIIERSRPWLAAPAVEPSLVTPPKARPVDAPLPKIAATAARPESEPPVSGETVSERQTKTPDQRAPTPVVLQPPRPEAGSTAPPRDQSGTDNAGATKDKPTSAQTMEAAQAVDSERPPIAPNASTPARPHVTSQQPVDRAAVPERTSAAVTAPAQPANLSGTVRNIAGQTASAAPEPVETVPRPDSDISIPSAITIGAPRPAPPPEFSADKTSPQTQPASARAVPDGSNPPAGKHQPPGGIDRATLDSMVATENTRNEQEFLKRLGGKPPAAPQVLSQDVALTLDRNALLFSLKSDATYRFEHMRRQLDDDWLILITSHHKRKSEASPEEQDVMDAQHLRAFGYLRVLQEYALPRIPQEQDLDALMIERKRVGLWTAVIDVSTSKSPKSKLDLGVELAKSIAWHALRNKKVHLLIGRLDLIRPYLAGRPLVAIAEIAAASTAPIKLSDAQMAALRADPAAQELLKLSRDVGPSNDGAGGRPSPGKTATSRGSIVTRKTPER